MVKKLLIISLACLAIGYTTGCTSHSSDSADVSDNPEEKLDADSSSSSTDDAAVADIGDDASANSSDQLAPDEKLPDDAAAAPPADNKDQMAADGSTPPPVDATTNPAEPTPEPVAGGAPDQQASNDTPPPPDTGADAAPAPTPEPAAPSEAPAPSASTGLKKIPTAAYQQGKTWVNAIYIARQNDDPKSISQKIYGSEDHVKQLCRINSYNCGRATKVGDKFYYNSPKRPDDHDTLKTFYEDAGVPAETYVAKDGDNIRKVGKQLLGSDRSWMELWATNQEIESKGALPAGTQIKYWPSTEAPSQAVATNEAGGDDLAGMNGEQAQQAPPPPSQAQQQAAMPPPPPPPAEMQPPPDQQNGSAAANVAPPPPPAEPPPPPPPPPPPMENKHQAAPAADSSMDDPNQTMALGVGAILLLAAVFLVISIRKKRKNKIDYNTATQTQIDT